MSARRQLSVVVVTYNSARHVERLLASVPAAAPGLETRVIVVDNASSDDTVARVLAVPGVRVVSAGGNVGYSAAINLARERAFPNAPLAVLNPDLVLDPGSLTRLVDTLDADPGIGVAVPRLLNGDRSLFHHLRDEPTLTRALGDAVLGDRWPGRPRRFSEVWRRDADYEDPQDVAWAGGAMWVVSAGCNEAVGGWDSARYFLYSEETDYASRARARGLRVTYVPDAVAVHHGGGSGSSPALVALMTVNRLRYFEARHGRFATGLLQGVLALQHLLRAHHAESRCALGFVLRRSTWPGLPSGTAGTPVDLGPGGPRRQAVPS